MPPYALPLMHSSWPKGPFFPLRSALHQDLRNAYPSQRLPAAGRCQFVPSATYRTRLRHYDVRSRCTSPLHSTDAPAALSLDQNETVEFMPDAVGLGRAHVGRRQESLWRLPLLTRVPLADAIDFPMPKHETTDLSRALQNDVT
jgi:hypothetical protein